MVLRGKFNGSLLYHEVPSVETLLSPVSVDRTLDFVAPSTVRGEGSATQAYLDLIDAPLRVFLVMILRL